MVAVAMTRVGGERTLFQAVESVFCDGKKVNFIRYLFGVDSKLTMIDGAHFSGIGQNAFLPHRSAV
jgi:hypothetical protein